MPLDPADPLVNPQDLLERPRLFIVHSERDEADLQLARSIAQQCEGFTQPQCGTLAELKQRSLVGIAFPGMTLLILSPAMVAEPSRRAALVKQMSRSYVQELYQHYCVCRGVSVASLRQYPELGLLLDNVMAEDVESGLAAVISALHDFATRVLPSSPQLARPVATLFGYLRPTLSALGLGLNMLVEWAASLAPLAAAALAVFWWLQWTPRGVAVVVWFVAFCAGFRLNHLQGGDLWPWLRGRWKLPHYAALDARVPPRVKLFHIGTFSIAGVLPALRLARASQWREAVAYAVIGLSAQAMLDEAITSHARRCLTLGAEAERALEIVETPDAMGSRLSPEALYRSAGGVLATFYGGALLSAAVSALMIAAAYPGARGLTKDPGTWLATAAVAGYLLPAVLFAYSGIAYLGKYTGLSSADGSLYQKLAGTPNVKLKVRRTVPADEWALVELFALDEQKLVLQWLYSIRVGLRARTFRNWSRSSDFAFISYAWRDDTENSAASGIAAACHAARIPHFLDKETLPGRQGVFRRPLADALARCTHVFLVVTPGLASGQVVRREIEMAMGRWRAELLPAIICVVDPPVCEQLVADPTVPLPLRFLLRFCPRMTPAESADLALVRYVTALTRRDGKSSGWRLLLSPSTAFSQVTRLPGIVASS